MGSIQRQPDRTPTLYYEQTESESEEEDDDYFSVEPIDGDKEDKEDQSYCEENQDVSGVAASSEAQADEGVEEPGPGDTTSIHSRENEETKKKEKKSQKKSSERDEEDMESENSDDADAQMDAVSRRKTS